VHTQTDVKDRAQAAIAAADKQIQIAADEYRARRVELCQQAFALGLISRRVIDVLAPVHEQPTCSDGDVRNLPGCTRCSLLCAMRKPCNILDGNVLTVTFGSPEVRHR
jgi:hypothetical protein